MEPTGGDWRQCFPPFWLQFEGALKTHIQIPHAWDTCGAYLWWGAHMRVWVIIWFAFSVLIPVLVRLLVLGTYPVLQPNDQLWSSMWVREKGGRERKRRERDEERKRERERDEESE